VSELERVNEAHGDALKRAKGDTQVALSILAHQLIGEQNENERLREALREIEALDDKTYYDDPSAGFAALARRALQPEEDAA
jgi:hypothetical protein